MCDKMAISVHILKIVENDPFSRLQMTAEEMFNRHKFFFLADFWLPNFGLKSSLLSLLNSHVCTAGTSPVHKIRNTPLHYHSHTMQLAQFKSFVLCFIGFM